ncbi:hypothetical protein A0J61_11584 [Choanephora cucurbitarum]|uniref:Uncharacterized protein n=1 Tax=Choanephora cucurbitarum TaxID=101091 RepID=A0A1C7MUC2_9FUNG|nr:hypothetical protein A0J61_11584 [Choanephora cucurbitarum]
MSFSITTSEHPHFKALHRTKGNTEQNTTCIKIVMATSIGVLSNQGNLDFANTEEIPAFLRNWNVNKKRKFKPKPSSNSPAKRQRRSGPDK